MIAWLNRDDRLLISIRNSFFSRSPFGQNSKVKCAHLGVVSGWVTDREVAPGSARVRTSAQKILVLICGASLDPARSNDRRRVCLGRYTVNKSVKILEVYLEDLPRVIGRGLCDLSSRGIR